MDAASHAPSAPSRLVPTKEVDPHNEVLDFWVETLGEKAGAIVIRFDGHSDTCDDIPIKTPDQSWSEYAQNSCGIENFMTAAVHYNVVSLIYWYNPRNSKVYIYRDSTTTVVDGKIKWVDEGLGFLTIEEAIDEIRALARENDFPFIVDTDFDTFLCITDNCSLWREEDQIARRATQVSNFLTEIDVEADCITSALSVTPELTPEKHVPKIREKVRELEELVI